ncbi:hypothetical protein [Paraburkholderia terrae]
MPKFQFLTAIVSLASLLTACETTGDPRAGGLFGWSQSKAQARQDDLRRQIDESNRESQTEQQQTAAMQAQQRGLQSEVGDLQAQLNASLAENHRLEAQLRDLARRKKLADSDLKRVQSELAANTRLTTLAQAAPPGARIDDREPSTAVQYANQRLNREILRLLDK